MPDASIKTSPGKDRLHIYRRACFGGDRGSRYEPRSRAPFETSGQGILATDPKSSSPAAGLTCGEYLQTHVPQRQLQSGSIWRRVSALRWLRLTAWLAVRRRHLRHMIGIKHRIAGHHAPQDSSVLVGQCDRCFLPAHTSLELHEPLAQSVAALGRRIQPRLHQGQQGEYGKNKVTC